MAAIAHDVPLAPLTTLRVGGPARSFREVSTQDDLISAVVECDSADEPLLLLAGGSNVVIADAGFDGTVIRIDTRGVHYTRDGDEVTVEVAAGEGWDRLVARSVSDGWSGIETLSGIPGSVGATPIQNVGAYGHELAEVLQSISVYDRKKQIRRQLGRDDCAFGYRTSRFKNEPNRWVVLTVTLRLVASAASVPIRYADLAERLGISAGERALPIKVRRAVLDVRRAKGMVLDIDDHDTWSVGSFFTNPIISAKRAAALGPNAPAWPAPDGRVKISAAWLIDQAGYGKGWPDESAAARLSTKHCLAITNRGSASADDVLKVARAVQSGVREKTGITLHPEPNLINCAL